MSQENLEWNEPLYLEGTRVGVVVLHGFTGSPQSLHEYALRLADAGHTVALPLLTGHGTTPDELERARWTDWVRDATAAYDWVRRRADRVFATGLSMGGTLSLWLAAEQPDISGVVTINAALRFPTEPLMHVAGLAGVPRWAKPVGNDIMQPGQDERCYDRIPVRAARQFALLMAQVRRRVSNVRCPALIFSSRQDHVVPPRNQRELLARLPSPRKHLVALDRSYHVATLDHDRETIFSGAIGFIGAHSA